MSRLDIYLTLHSEILRILEQLHSDIVTEVERQGINHEIYHYLDRRFAIYFSDYGGINCRILRERIEQNREKIVKELLPRWIREYVELRRRFGRIGKLITEKSKEKKIEIKVY